MKDHALSSVQSGKTEAIASTTAYCAGFVDALAAVESLPERILSDGEPITDEIDDTILLNRPHSMKVF